MSILDFAENSLELRQCTWLMVEVTQCMSNAKCFFLQSLPAEVSMVGEKMGKKKNIVGGVSYQWPRFWIAHQRAVKLMVCVLPIGVLKLL